MKKGLNRENPPFLALDLGAGNGRAFLGTFVADTIRREEIHRFSNKPVYLGDTFYWDFLHLWENLLEALRRCAAAGAVRLAGIGIDTWNADFGLINGEGVLIMNPVSYRDRSAESVTAEIEAVVSDRELYGLTGIGSNAIFALARLYHLKNGPAKDLFSAAGSYLPLADLFRFYLSGEKSGEETILWGSQLVSVTDRRWLVDLIRRLEIPEAIFPPIREAGTPAGELSREVRRTTGLEPAPVIAVAEHDTVSAAVSVYQRGEGDVFISTGTWSVMGRYVKEPFLDYEARKKGYLNEIAPGGIVFAKNIMGFYILEECIAAWKRRGIDCSYARLIEAAEASPPFGSRIDVNDPGLFSTSNMEESLREHFRKRGERWPEKQGPLVRAVLEGLVFSYRLGLDDLELLTGKKIDRVHVIGGGTKNRLFCRMIADGTGRKVTAAAAEPAVLGNLGMQALAVGRIDSIGEFHRIIENTVSPAVYRPENTEAWDREYAEMQSRANRSDAAT